MSRFSQLIQFAIVLEHGMTKIMSQSIELNPMRAGFIGPRILLWHELAGEPANILAIGGPDSGKTIFLEMAFGPWFTAIASPRTHRLRLFIFDSDTTLPLCEGAGIPPANRFFLDLLDVRGEEYGFIGWKAGEDLTTRSRMEVFLSALFSRRNDRNVECKKLIILCIMEYLIQLQGTDWELHDVFEILYSFERLQALLKDHPSKEYAFLYNLAFDTTETLTYLLSDLWENFSFFRYLAMSWHSRTRKGSISEWFKTSGVFSLGDDLADSHYCQLNRGIFNLFSYIVMNELEESEVVSTGCIFDNLTSFAPLPGLADLFAEGWKKGLCCGASFNTLVLAKELLGEDTLQTIFDSLGTFAMLGTSSVETAKFFALRCNNGVSFSGSSEKTTLDLSFWLRLPKTSPYTGFNGVIESKSLVTGGPMQEFISVPASVVSAALPACTNTVGKVVS